MAESNDTKPESRKLGSYLVVSPGAISKAVEKQVTAYTKTGKLKPIGEILLEQGIISQEELENSVRNQRIARLAGCPVFASLSKSDLAALSKKFTEISALPGETIMMQGEEDPSIYIIGSGLVEVYRADNAGNEIHIANVGAGEPIGEMGYFSGGKRTACVRALETTQLLRAEYDDLTDYFTNVPRVAIAFAQVVEHRRAELERLTKENR